MVKLYKIKNNEKVKQLSQILQQYMRGIYCTKRRKETEIYDCQYNGMEASVAAEILRTGGEQTVITQ